MLDCDIYRKKISSGSTAVLKTTPSLIKYTANFPDQNGNVSFNEKRYRFGYIWKLAVWHFLNSIFIPLQNLGHYSEQDFGTEYLETVREQTLGKNVCKLIIRRDVFNLMISTKNPFSNKMVVNLDVLCASVKKGLEAIAKAETLSHQILGGSAR